MSEVLVLITLSYPEPLVERLRQATYASEFAAVFGGDVFDDVDRAYAAVTMALAQYQREDAEFAHHAGHAVRHHAEVLAAQQHRAGTAHGRQL